MKLKSIILLLLFLLVFQARSEVNIPAGNVNGIWTRENSPYNIEGEITVPDGENLTIESGSRVVFQGYYKLNIQGTLLAAGTENDTITFTTSDSTGYYNYTHTGWHGIRFDSTATSNDTSKIQYCKIEYGKAIGDSLENCGGAIYLRAFSKVIISDNLIKDNYAELYGGGIFCDTSSPIIKNNSIIGNYAVKYGAGISCRINSNAVITNNIITNNRADKYGGGVLFSSSSPSLINNLICNNYAEEISGGIFCFSSAPIITNNTVCQNKTGGWGGGLYLNKSSPSLINTVVYSNSANLGSQVFLYDNDSNPIFDYCNIEKMESGFGGEGAGDNYDASGFNKTNFDNDPGFIISCIAPGYQTIIPVTAWQLQKNSSCINSGLANIEELNLPVLDLMGNPRIYDDAWEIIDIGAIEFQGVMNSFSVSGTVTCNETGFCNIELTEGVITDENGRYCIIVDKGADIFLNPQLEGYDFYPNNFSGIEINENIEQDFTAIDILHPIVYAETQTVTNQENQYVIVQSNNPDGFVYLILDDTIPTEPEPADLVEAVEMNNGASSVVTSAFSDIQITSEELPLGTYHAYTVNSYGYVSQKSENQILIKETLAIDENILPIEDKLYQNYPNPFNPVTTIRYDLQNINNINLTIYNYKGEKVWELEEKMVKAGKHSIIFDGSLLSSGIYFYILQINGKIDNVKKMMLIK